jgi:hypothetical protein
MFDGTIPVEIERLKEIYRAIDQLSMKLGGLAADARIGGASKGVQKRIDALEQEADKIKELFGGVLTGEEQEELMGIKPKRRKRRPRPWEAG